MDDNKKEWLKQHYKEVEHEGPYAKRIKYEDIHKTITTVFPTDHMDSKTLSRAIKEVFPSSVSRRAGKDRKIHIFGVEENVMLQEQTVMDELEHERRKNAELAIKIEELEQQVHHLQRQQPVVANLVDQMHQLSAPHNAVYHGPNTVQHFAEFTIEAILRECSQLAPDVLQLMQKLGNVDDVDKIDGKVLMAMCALIRSQTKKALGVQLLMSFMLIARSTSSQALKCLNQAGVCMSYNTTWKYLKELTSQSRYTEVIKDGHWLWVFDNLNVHQKVRHEREDRHSNMLNITSRLAVKIKNLPDWQFDWKDNTPQHSVDSLTVSDFLPNEDDATNLKIRAISYVKQFIIDQFSSLADLHQFLDTTKDSQPIEPSKVVPMKVLFKDEKFTDETIDILSELVKDADLSESKGPQVVLGDQATCKTIRAGKLWRQTEKRQMDSLKWVCEQPGDFHFLWECLRTTFTVLWGKPSQSGSICNLREIVRRMLVDKGVKVFNVGDEFLVHTFKGHLLAAVMTYFKIKSPKDAITHPATKAWLEETAKKLVSTTVMPLATDSTDPVFGFHRSFLHLGFLYIDLREAIRWDNGPQIVRHWKYWLVRFLACGCTNYAKESVLHISNLSAAFPKHISFIATHNRTVNISGTPGRAKPVDQLIEHYNLIFKQTIRSSGSNLTHEHIKNVSLAVLFLMEAATKADSLFNTPKQSTAHTIADAQADINKIASELIEQQCITEVSGRTTPAFTDGMDAGWKKLSTTSWLNDILYAKSQQDESIDDMTEVEREINIDYELADVN